MKRTDFFLLMLAGVFMLSACGAIPTLPPLDSTVTVKTPRFTNDPELPTATGQSIQPSVTVRSAEITSTPPGTYTATVKPSATHLPATKTPYFTLTPSATATKSPTQTPSATNTPQATATSTKTPYSLQSMTAHYLVNFTHPDLGCDWLGVAGQVFNSAGVVQKDILVKSGGKLAGAEVLETMTMPLAEPDIDLAYGPGGYEITLANSPAASQGSVWVQLFDLDGNPISEQVYLTTYDDCQKNLILLNFTEE
ncbi:MAG: hypothetical protein P8Y34_05105 [Anaerolineales bacterium]